MQPLLYCLREPTAKDNSITMYYACSRGTKQPWRNRYNEIRRDWVAKHKRTTCNGVGNCSSKTGSRRQSEKKDDFEALFKRTFSMKITSAKNEKIYWQMLTRISPRTWQQSMTTIMQPFQCDLRPEIQETQKELRTQEQPLVAEHRGAWGATNSRMKQPQPHPPHTRGTFHRRLQPLYTEKHQVLWSGFLSKTKPMQHSCSHYNAFRSITWLTRISLRTWQESMTTIMQPFQCDLQPEIQETQRTPHTGTTTRCRTQRRMRSNQLAHETTVAAPAAHTRYLSSPAAATLHGETQGSVLPLPQQNKAHATFMQPLQCIL